MITQLIHRAATGDRAAFDAAFAAIQLELRGLAARRLAADSRATLSPTMLVNETWLKLARIAHGPLFRRVTGQGKTVGANRLNDQEVARLVKRTALAAGVLASGVPAAHAAASDTDRPKVTAKHFDFGKNWTVNAPRNGGYAYWNLSNGVTSIDVEGYLYLTNNECGRLRVEYYNDSHTLLTSKNAPRRCANGTAKRQW